MASSLRIFCVPDLPSGRASFPCGLSSCAHAMLSVRPWPTPSCGRKTAMGLIGSLAAMRELAPCEDVDEGGQHEHPSSRLGALEQHISGHFFIGSTHG